MIDLAIKKNKIVLLGMFVFCNEYLFCAINSISVIDQKDSILQVTKSTMVEYSLFNSIKILIRPDPIGPSS